jgi:hypothetical protein
MVSEVVVNANPYEDGAECWVVELSSVEDPEDIVAYAHVTGEDSDGVHILAGRTFCWNDYFTQIGDFAGDGDTSNDHLHFGCLAPRRRNPLWDSPDYPHLAPGDGGPPTIEGVAFARYGGSYDLWNTLYSVADVAGGDIAHALEGEDVDIIVYAHDDDNRVGVRALYYKDSDPWEDEPIGDEWIPFCDFTGDLPSPGDADVVYAFQRDLAGNDVLTDPITGSRMWYIVTNTTETANSFDDTGAWHTPLVSEGMTILT